MKGTFRLFFVVILSLSPLVNAQSNEYRFTHEEELLSDSFTLISAHFYAQNPQYFYTKNKLKIAYKVFTVKNSKATIVISSGRTESMAKYQELIYDFNANGYSVYILDHRGQGYSERLLDDIQIGHVNDFFNYVLDLKFFVQNIVPKDKKKILLGHSMGGTVASLYAQRYEKDFDALVLTSPMHQPELLSKSLNGLACRLVQKRKSNLTNYMFGKSSYDSKKQIFSKNHYTHSKTRFELVHTLYEKEPMTKIGGPSFGWVSQACLWSRTSVEMAVKIKIPVLLLQAGEDTIVNAAAQEEFCKNVGEKCELETIDGSYHEMLIEKDSIRDKVLNRILDFISSI